MTDGNAILAFGLARAGLDYNQIAKALKHWPIDVRYTLSKPKRGYEVPGNWHPKFIAFRIENLTAQFGVIG